MFLTQANLATTDKPDIWVTTTPLIWCDPVFGRLTCPQGFYTDLASIPRIIRNLPAFDPDGISRRPAIIHDWLYGSVEGRLHGKNFADRFLHAALLSEGASSTIAWAYYWGVYLGGGSGWRSDGAKLISARS